jgi:hypothetical protein
MKYQRKTIIRGVKGRLHLTCYYSNLTETKIVKIDCTSRSVEFNNEIDIKRAIAGAVLQGLYKAIKTPGMGSGTYFIGTRLKEDSKSIDYNIVYGNDDVTIKNFTRNNKKYTGIWVKGRKGVYKVTPVKGQQRITENLALNTASDIGLYSSKTDKYFRNE